MMTIKHATIALATLLLPLATCLTAAEPSQAAREATEKATRMLGLQRIGSSKVTAHAVVVQNDKTPFLADKINGKSVFRVQIDGVQLPVARRRGPPRHNRHISRFDVLIDPESGTVLKISSPWPQGVTKIAPQPPAKEAERQLKNVGESYDGFPAKAPKIDFAQALAAVHINGLGSVAGSKQIIAHYVLHSKLQHKRRPVWIIELRGFPPFAPKGPGRRPGAAADYGISPDARNHMRHGVDAETGKVLFANTAPQPVAPRKTED